MRRNFFLYVLLVVIEVVVSSTCSPASEEPADSVQDAQSIPDGATDAGSLDADSTVPTDLTREVDPSDTFDDAIIADADGGDDGDETQLDAPSDESEADCHGGGCSSDPDLDGGSVGDSSDSSTQSFSIDNLIVVRNPSNSLSSYVLWRTRSPADTQLVIRCDEDFEQRLESGVQTTEHEVFVMGLWAGADCVGEVRSESSTESATATFDLNIPDRLTSLPTISLGSSTDIEQVQPGWTLFNANSGQASSLPTGIIVDEQGRIRWYHKLAVDESGSDNALTVVDGGVMFGGGGDLATHIVDWDGSTSWVAPFSSHHEAAFLDGPRDLYLFRRAEACQSSDIPPIAPIVVWNPLNDTQRWRWHLCDHYLPPTIFNDWAHPNGIDMFPEGDAIIVSVRNQSALVRVDIESGDIDWVLGFAGRPDDGWNGDFAMAETDRFYEQHAPEIQPNGNILIFDNGSCEGCPRETRPLYDRGWSRAVEIAYDTSTMEAELVWEFRPEQDVYSPIFGDADRLANGNTLVTFGVDAVAHRPQILEVNANSEIVWELVFHEEWGIYRADRIEPYYGHVTNPGD